MSERDVDRQLSQLLEEYVLAQDAYHRDHDRYGGNDSLSARLSSPPEVRLWVVWFGPVNHSAYARSAYFPERMCVIFDGERPPGLDHDRAREPVCGASSRFLRFVSGWLPPLDAVEQPAARWARRIGVATGVVLAALLLVFGIPRWVPWGYRLLYWTPAVLSAGLLVLSLVAVAAGGMAGGMVAVGLIYMAPALLLNLGLFGVPRALLRTGRRIPPGAAVFLGAGAIYYGAVGASVARSDEADPDVLHWVVGLLVLYLLGLVHLVLAYRRWHATRQVVQPQPGVDEPH